MAKKAVKKPARKKAAPKIPRWKRIRRWMLRIMLALAVLFLLRIIALSVIQPPMNAYMSKEARRLGTPIKYQWVDFEDVAPVMARSVVAAEDADFCLHWGFDMSALRQAIEDGGERGASTITQQVVKNVLLWHGQGNERYVRKALEALLTPVVEIFWSKRRIVEVYMNVAEFDEGVFGVSAAARHYFGVSAADLNATQAARLAAILPNPKGRSASNPGAFTRNRAAAIIDGAATIAADGRDACFGD